MIFLLAVSQSGWKPTAEDDRQVIETSLLECLKAANWQVADWKVGDVAVVDPVYSKREESLGERLDEMIWHYGRSKSPAIQSDLRVLKRIREEVGTEGIRTAVATAIGDLKLDDRIVVSDKPWPMEERFGRGKIRSRSGVTRSIRIKTYLSRPIYARNGAYAFLTAHAPWSIHGADIHFILKRKDTTWSVILVVPFIYV